MRALSYRITESPNSYAIGSALASGDLNGDGFSDLLVGERYAGVSGGRETRVYHGSRGTLTTPTATLQGDADGLFGRSLASGDVDGDGFADAIIGAPGANRVVVFSGSEDGGANLGVPESLDGTGGFGMSVASGG